MKYATSKSNNKTIESLTKTKKNKRYIEIATLLSFKAQLHNYENQIIKNKMYRMINHCVKRATFIRVR